MHVPRTGQWVSVWGSSCRFSLWAKVPVALCWRCCYPFLPHKWLFSKWLQLDGKSGVKQGPCQHRPSRFEVNFAPWLRVFLYLSEVAEMPRWSHRVRWCHPFVPPSSPSFILFALLPPPFPPSSPHPCAPLPPHGPGPMPALSLTPMFANHFFPCQQVNCFVLPFPAFITLCKLSDMSSTGARQSTRCANAKIMRFGIINEDKLAVAVLLSARARLHYSLNLPEKMT